MPKIRVGAIAKRFGVGVEEVVELARDKLAEEMITGRGMNLWIGEEGQKPLFEALEFIPEIVPKHYKGKVIGFPPNPRYVFAVIKDLGKVSVMVPARCFREKMRGKVITIERISDDKGSTYRFNKPKLFGGR